MGQSTDALVAFGFDLGDEVEWPEVLQSEDDDEAWPDLESYIAQKAGLSRPETDNYKDPAWAAYWQAKREAEEAYPVEIVRHCHHEYPMYILALRGTVQRARRGYPEKLKITQPTAAEAAALQAFCDEVGLEWSKPEWLLFSDWG